MKIDPKDASADAYARDRLVLLLQAASCRRPRQYADKAAAAGRSVTQLKENIDKLEKAIAAGAAVTEEQMAEARRSEQKAWEERNKKIEAANNAVRSKNPATPSRGPPRPRRGWPARTPVPTAGRT